MKVFCLGLILWSLTGTADMAFLNGLQGSHYQKLHSAVVGHDYHIYVQVPKGSAATPATKATPELIIIQAEYDKERYRNTRKKWLDYWVDKPHHWKHHVITAQGHNHKSSVPAAFQ